ERKNDQHIKFLQERLKILQFDINQTIPLPIIDNPKEQKSSPSHSKMDKTGVHSPTNVERAIISAKGTISPVQMVTGKDLSNPLMADNLLKSVRTLPASFNNIATTGTETSNKTREVIQEYPNPEPEPVNSDPEDLGSRSDEYNPSMDQFAQDLSEDNDFGMSFDSISLHNLDT
ncbi:hypothetical protein H5410_001502, partial [Solanum commersonii]